MNVPPPPASSPAPSYLLGLRCFWTGFRSARGTEGLKGAYGQYALAMALLSVLLVVVFSIAAFYGVDWILDRVEHDALEDETVRTVLRVVGLLVAGVVSLVLAPVVSMLAVGALFPILGERLFYAGLKRLDPARAERLAAARSDSILISLRLGVRRFARVLVFQALGFSLSFVPIVGVFIGPAVSIAGAAWIVGWEMLDPYLSRFGFTIAQQREVASAHRKTLAGFGAPAVMIMAVPLVGPLAFPFVQIAGAHLMRTLYPNEALPCAIVGVPVPPALQADRA